VLNRIGALLLVLLNTSIKPVSVKGRSALFLDSLQPRILRHAEVSPVVKPRTDRFYERNIGRRKTSRETLGILHLLNAGLIVLKKRDVRRLRSGLNRARTANIATTMIESHDFLHFKSIAYAL